MRGRHLPFLFALLPACTFVARGPERYAADTRALLEARGDALRACYDDLLRGDPTLQGTVRVKFRVEQESGRIVQAEVDDAGSSAPEPVRRCVVQALDGLRLEPPDARDGEATFSWQFEIAPPS